jgi:hypothetical protein
VEANSVDELFKLPWERDFFREQSFEEVVELTNVSFAET